MSQDQIQMIEVLRYECIVTIYNNKVRLSFSGPILETLKFNMSNFMLGDPKNFSRKICE